MHKLEKEIDNYIASILQQNKIDFIRINNSNTRGQVQSFFTYAFEQPFSCSKFWPDFTFAYNKKVYMIENGLKIGNQMSNQERKDKQKERLLHWEKNGNCKVMIILSVEGAANFFKKIKLIGNNK